MRWLLLVALIACAKKEKPAPAPEPSTIAAGCSGRWTGRIKWTSPNCSEATLADVAPFDVVVDAKASEWSVTVATPPTARVVTKHVAYRAEGCTVSVSYDVPLPPPRTAQVDLDFANGPDGPSAHARLAQVGLEKNACTAVGLATLEYTAGNGRVPTLTAAQRTALGSYVLDVVWEESSCGQDAPVTLQFALEHRPTHGDVGVTGLAFPVESLGWVTDAFEITANIDSGPFRHHLVFTTKTDGSGTATFTVLDGDLVVCTRKGALRGTRSR